MKRLEADLIETPEQRSLLQKIRQQVLHYDVKIIEDWKFQEVAGTS